VWYYLIMNLLYRIIFKIFSICAVALGTAFVFLYTNLGLQCALYLTELAIPGHLNIKQVSGALLSHCELAKLTYSHNSNVIHIDKLSFNFDKKIITLDNIIGVEHFLPTIFNQPNNFKTIIIDMNYNKISQNWHTNINANGFWKDRVTKAEIKLSTISILDLLDYTEITVENLIIKIANDIFTIKEYNDYEYKIDLKVHDLQLISKNLNGDITADANISRNNGISLLDLRINSHKIQYDDILLSKVKLHTKNPLNDVNASISTVLTIKEIVLFDDKIHNFKSYIDGNFTAHKISTSCNFLENSIIYHATGSYKNHIWRTISNDPNNHMNISFNFQHADKLDGNITLDLNDFSQIGEILPKVTRVKAKLDADIKFTGTWDTPKVIADVKIINITATIPSLGVKIKPMTILLNINEKQKLTVDINGKMRQGSGEFTLTGYIDLNDPQYENLFKFKGNEIEFIKTQNKNLIAKANLELVYDHTNYNLNTSGDIKILGGSLHFENHKTIVKSQDIVFTDHRASKTARNINIIPNLFIRIDEPLPVSGFNIDGDITGKLLITYNNNNLYGEGRITIKKGTYALPGQKLTIDRGRIIYPQGTLLSNPILDIKMIKLKSIDKSVIDAGIFVSGTARNPIISNVGITGGNNQTISQALIAGSSVIPHELSEILSISDIGVMNNNNEATNFFSNTETGDGGKSFYIGRQFGDNFYIQYQRNIQDAIDSIKLTYSINNYLSIGIDADSDQGSGADLSFTIEKD
jgi:hypothetical protein